MSDLSVGGSEWDGVVMGRRRGAPGVALAAILAAALAAPGPGRLAAQDGAAPPAEPEPVAAQGEEITVVETLPYVPATSSIVTKLPLALHLTPANVGVVGDRLMDDQGALTLADALVNVSGAGVEAGAGVFDFFVLRGFDSLSSGLVLTDGAPEPEVTFYPLYNVERVEVFKGPAGFLYGSNPLAGAVNLVRRQPEPARFGSLAVEGGSFGAAAAEVDWNHAGEDGALAFRLGGTWRRTDGYREGKEGELLAINPALAWRPSERFSLVLNAEGGSSDFTPDAGLPLIGGELPPVSRDAAYESPSDHSEQDFTRLQADAQAQLSPAWSLRNKLYHRALDWRTDGTLLLGAIPLGPAAPVAVLRAQTGLEDDQALLGNQLELAYTGSFAGLDHRLVMGLEALRAEDEYTLVVSPLPCVALLAPSLELPLPFCAVGAPPAAGDSRADVVAPYVIDHLSLSPRLQALAGLRYDRIDFSDRVSGTERSDGEWSPMLGLTFAPSARTSLYASAAQSFAPPSPRVVGERRPERSRQVEVGLRQSWRGGRVRTTTSLYELERENIAIPDDNGFTQQAGDQRARGAELELAVEPRAGLAVVASYAYTDSELTRFAELVQTGPTSFLVLDRSGNRSAFAPEHLARGWVSQRWGNGLRLGAGLRWIGERYTAEDNLVELDAALLLDAGAGWEGGRWGVALDLDNLTDEEHETRAFGSSSAIPAAPFGARLRVERRF